MKKLVENQQMLIYYIQKETFEEICYVSRY